MIVASSSCLLGYRSGDDQMLSLQIRASVLHVVGRSLELVILGLRGKSFDVSLFGFRHRVG